MESVAEVAADIAMELELEATAAACDEVVVDTTALDDEDEEDPDPDPVLPELVPDPVPLLPVMPEPVCCPLINVSQNMSFGSFDKMRHLTVTIPAALLYQPNVRLVACSRLLTRLDLRHLHTVTTSAPMRLAAAHRAGESSGRRASNTPCDTLRRRGKCIACQCGASQDTVDEGVPVLPFVDSPSRSHPSSSLNFEEPEALRRCVGLRRDSAPLHRFQLFDTDPSSICPGLATVQVSL